MENTMITIYETTQENLVSKNETHLVWAAQEGELEAFNQLVLVYQDRIFSLTLLILGDLKQIVRQALIQLGADYRAMAVLIHLEDYTYLEAGQILGIPPGTVKSRLARGRSRANSILRNFEPILRSV